MKKEEKQFYMNKKSVAYWSGCSGIEIKDILYGINDSVVFVAGAWYGKKSVHKARIYNNASGNLYFKYHGYTIPFDECIRM